MFTIFHFLSIAVHRALSFFTKVPDFSRVFITSQLEHLILIVTRFFSIPRLREINLFYSMGLHLINPKTDRSWLKRKIHTYLCKWKYFVCFEMINYLIFKPSTLLLLNRSLLFDLNYFDVETH